MEQERESKLPRGVPLEDLLNCDEVLERLGHLAAGDGEVARVQEVADPVVVAVVRLRLWRRVTLPIGQVFCWI